MTRTKRNKFQSVFKNLPAEINRSLQIVFGLLLPYVASTMWEFA